VLRGIAPDGKIQWAYSLPSTPDHARVMGLTVASGQDALALVGPIEGSISGSDFSLIRLDPAGSIVAQTSFRSSPGSLQSRHSGYLTLGATTGLAIANHQIRLMEQHDHVNELGFRHLCGEGDMADIIFFDADSLKEIRRTRLDRFGAQAALATNDGWLVVGDIRVGCMWETRAVVYAVKLDGSVTELWRDGSIATTSARGIRRIGNVVEIVGYANRSVAIREALLDQSKHDSANLRLGNEAYLSKEVFSVRLSENGREQRRDFVAAGLPVAPAGMAVSGDRSIIFGTVGLRPLWLSR
jgi:hypothetical protein